MDNKRITSLPFINIINELNLGENVYAKEKLSNLLTRTTVGNKDILVSPIGKYGPDKLLREWTNIYEEAVNSGKISNDVLIDLEDAQADKFSPRSIALPWSRRKANVDQYYVDTNIDYSSLNCETDAPKSLRPLSYENASKWIKKSTSAGLPSMRKKGEVLDETLRNIDYYLDRKDPAVLYTRTQESAKTRDVFGVPLADVLNEMRFYRPILEYQKRLPWRSALSGPDKVAKHLTEIIERAISEGLTLISIDFSAYDTTIKQGLQFKVGEYYKSLFQKSYFEEIDNIIQRKSTIGLVTPDGVMTGPHGEPSGSAFTNEDDSLAQHCIAMSSNSTIDELFDIQGDDGVYAVKPESVNSLYNSFKKYGLNVNVDKSFESPNYLVYLQNLYHPDFKKDGVIGGVYPTFRALNRIVYQERWANFEDYGVKGKDYYAIRTLSILENCRNHPLFEEFVKFILSKDKYNLEVTSRGINDYVKFMTDTEGTEGLIVNQYGDDLAGIRNWRSFRLVRSLSGS
jgi:hypothetical protein